ncbi:MAG: hypothetical protein QOC62_2866, partial [Mycobacterium sp.]|nr:hypothetical protein [Mycobacterium sp.]
ETYEPNWGSRSQSSQFGATLEWQEFLPQDREEAQLVTKGTPGNRVLIPDWSQFIKIFDQAISRRLEKSRT